MLVEVSEYPINREPGDDPKIDEYIFLYDKAYYHEDVSDDMQFRESMTIKEIAQDFARTALEGDEEGLEKKESGEKSELPELGENQLHNFVTELMREIPEDIEWIDSRFYHQFKQNSRIWISVDTLVMPQSDAIHCVIFHLLPPGGLMYNQKGTSGVACRCLTGDTAIWMQRFSPNQTFMKYPKIDEDSLIIIEIMRVSYITSDTDNDSFFERDLLKPDDVIFNTVGMSVLAATTAFGQLANGYYQLPIVRDAIDFDQLTAELEGEATAEDICAKVYEKNFESGKLIENASLFIRLYEEAFEVGMV
jgi:hypothetical protein